MNWKQRSIAMFIFSSRLGRADDKSCYEDGRWKGDEITPDGTSGYDEDEKKNTYDLSDEDEENQPAICESIRILMDGIDWTIELKDGKADCTILSSVTDEEDKDDFIRSVECSSAPTQSPTETNSPTPDPTNPPSAAPSFYPTTTPTVSPTDSPTPLATVESAPPTSAPSPLPTLLPTRAPNEELSDTYKPRTEYYVVTVVLGVLLFVLIFVALWWMTRRERALKVAVDKSSVQAGTSGTKFVVEAGDEFNL